MYGLGRVNVACPNINLFSLYYEPYLIQNQDTQNPWHIHNPAIFKSSRYLHLCQNYCYVFRNYYYFLLNAPS